MNSLVPKEDPTAPKAQVKENPEEEKTGDDAPEFGSANDKKDEDGDAKMTEEKPSPPPTKRKTRGATSNLHLNEGRRMSLR